jgi:hypothetical protein
MSPAETKLWTFYYLVSAYLTDEVDVEEDYKDMMSTAPCGLCGRSCLTAAKILLTASGRAVREGFQVLVICDPCSDAYDVWNERERRAAAWKQEVEDYGGEGEPQAS